MSELRCESSSRISDPSLVINGPIFARFITSISALDVRWEDAERLTRLQTRLLADQCEYCAGLRVRRLWTAAFDVPLAIRRKGFTLRPRVSCGSHAPAMSLELRNLERQNMKTKLTRLICLAVAASGLLFSGCAWQIGGDKPGNTVCKPTRGQELIDLKK